MIDINELKTALAQIKAEKEAQEEAERQQQLADSETRKLEAIEYIKTLKLNVSSSLSLAEQKAKLYANIDLLKLEIAKTPIGELKQKLQNRIEAELVKINEIKDQQRALKVG